jgi:hypothetical protein
VGEPIGRRQMRSDRSARFGGLVVDVQASWLRGARDAARGSTSASGRWAHRQDWRQPQSKPPAPLEHGPRREPRGQIHLKDRPRLELETTSHLQRTI